MVRASKHKKTCFHAVTVSWLRGHLYSRHVRRWPCGPIQRKAVPLFRCTATSPTHASPAHLVVGAALVGCCALLVAFCMRYVNGLCVGVVVAWLCGCLPFNNGAYNTHHFSFSAQAHEVQYRPYRILIDCKLLRSLVLVLLIKNLMK